MAGRGAGTQRVAAALARSGLPDEITVVPDSTRSASEAAAALGCDVGCIVKSLVFRAVETDSPVLVLVSGGDRVDEEKLALAVGERVEQASGAYVRDRTGYAIGGVPPVGHDEGLVTFADEGLLARERVWAAAGSPHAVFPVAPGDLVRAARATVVCVARA
ncbi:MAG: YbaK/EbsC family protein [Actinomycetota bacterium]|nr:YbaK/EbsC family protein [Actinomycetota bacterium]